MSEKHYLGGGTCHVHGVVHVGEAKHHLLYHVLQHVRACAGKVMRLYTTRRGREAESKPRVLPRSRSNSPVQESGRFRTGSPAPPRAASSRAVPGTCNRTAPRRLPVRTRRSTAARPPAPPPAWPLPAGLPPLRCAPAHAARRARHTPDKHISLSLKAETCSCAGYPGMPGGVRYPGGYPATKTQQNLGRTSGHCASRAPSAVFPTFASTAAWDAGHKNA